jgi:hypothetical protein
MFLNSAAKQAFRKPTISLSTDENCSNSVVIAVSIRPRRQAFRKRVISPNRKEKFSKSVVIATILTIGDVEEL